MPHPPDPTTTPTATPPTDAGRPPTPPPPPATPSRGTPQTTPSGRRVPRGETEGDLVTSWLRTTVPTLWGATVSAALAAVTPHLPADLSQPLEAWLSSDSTTLVVAVGAVAAWHATWRLLERRAPRWLVRLALGSPRTPSYAP